MNIENFNRITNELRQLERKVTLVAVTKSVGVEETNAVIRAGVSAIGENRIEDFEIKLPQLLPIEKHFIGQIQSRKIKRIVELFDVIQSVGSLKHLEHIEREATDQNKNVQVLLQFNISQESQKGGFGLSANSRELADEVDIRLRSIACRQADMDNAISAIHHVKIIGVMGMATDTKDTAVVRKQFRLLKGIRDQLHGKYPEITELSIGMSNDYKIALEEGATMLRIGRALFAE